MKRLHTGLALLPSKSQVCGFTFKLFPLSWACRFLIMNEYDLSCHLQWPGEVLFEGSAGHQILSERVAWLQFELSRSVLAGFDALAPLTLEALLDATRPLRHAPHLSASRTKGHHSTTCQASLAYGRSKAYASSWFSSD